MAGLWQKLFKQGLPADFTGALDQDEAVLAFTPVRGGGYVVATSLGLWLPTPRRVGWHLVSKAVWDRSALVVTEAVATGTVGAAVLLADLPPRRFALAQPGTVPEVVRERVTSSIRSSHRCELPGGGAWFVQRRVPGLDGVVLQVRADPGTAPGAVEAMVSEVVQRLSPPAPPG